MPPAVSGRVLLGAATLTTLVIGIATAVDSPPKPTVPTRSAVTSSHSYARLLTDPLHGGAVEATLQSDAHRGVVRQSPCSDNARAQLVLVSIQHQHLWTCSGDHVVLSTPVTTGRTSPGDATPRGVYSIDARVANTTLHPSSGVVIPVAYWIPFKNNVYGFHNAPWQTMPFGSADYRTEGSIGCIHVPLDALRELFDWVHVGTTVRIG